MAPTILNGSNHFFINLHKGNDGGQRVGNFVPFTDNGTIAKSCIFNDGDSPQLSKTPSGAGNRRTFTFSVWLKRGTLTGAEQYILSASNSASSTKYDFIYFDTDNCIRIQHHNGSSVEGQLKTNRTFEDTSKWYHLVYRCDTTQSTATDRMRLYIDGDEITSFSIDTNPSQNYDTDVNDATLQSLGKPGWHDGVYFDGYMAEVNLADGTSYGPDTFGITDTSTGRWIPKSLGSITYGTNGYRLTFANSAGQTIGDDTSGNGNDYAVSNIAVSDLTTDSPTQNHMTFDPLRSSDWTFTEGNLQCAGTPSSGAGRHSLSNMIMPKSGKYYFEMTVDVNNDSPRYFGLAKADSSVTEGTTANVLPRVLVIRNGGTSDGHFISDGQTASANGFATTNGTVINFALDADNEKLYVGKDGSYYDFEGGSGNPTNGTGATFSNIYKTIDWRAINMSFSTGSGGTSHKVTWNFGQKTFAHTAPTGFSALQQDNFPETGKGIPGFVWIKNRTEAYTNMLFNSSRGVNKRLRSDATSSELTYRNMLNKFLKGGCQVGEEDSVNKGTNSFVSWNWVANGGTTTANTDGSGATIASTTQANQTAGFSLIVYTGTGSNGTVAHGLSQAPEWVVVKNLDNGSEGWSNYHVGMTNATKIMTWNNTNGQADSATDWNSTAPTNKVVHVGTNARTNNNTQEHIMYAWHSVKGFSKFGSYTGNGNADGPFIYLGFKPSWIMLKGNAASSWIMLDNKRNPSNPINRTVWANLATAESTSYTWCDFLSNGFKMRDASNGLNNSSATYIYMAFAEHPFAGTSSINPVTAR